MKMRPIRIRRAIAVLPRFVNCKIGKDVTDWVIRGGLLFVGFLLLHLYARGLFVIYMATQGFYSYDFVASAEFGMGSFFLLAEAFVVAAALMFFGLLLPFFHCYRYGQMNKGMLLLFLVVGVFSWILFISAASGISSERWPQLVVLFSVLVLIALYISAMLFSSTSTRIRCFAFVWLMLAGITIVVPKEMAAMLQFGLGTFGVGGNCVFVFQDRSELLESETASDLVFLSPRNAYVRIPERPGITTIPLDGLQSFRVYRRNGAGE